jgi:tetratricopeptide (TPR) repeat protein
MRHGLQGWLKAIILVCAGLAVPPAHAAMLSDHELICGGGAKTVDEMIEACDWIIESGGTSQLSPAQALNLRGNHFSAKGDYGKAIEDYSRSISLDGFRDSAVFFNRGLAYGANGNADLAIEDFNQQIALTPQYYEAFYHRGVLLIGKQQFGAAMRDFDAVVRLCHGFFDGWFFCQAIITKTYFRQGQVDLATRNFGSALHNFIRAVGMVILPRKFY